MRKVIYSDYVRRDKEGNILERYAPGTGSVSKMEEISCALFHQFGLEVEEGENGFASYSTAIIELPDGQVKNIRAEYIRFIKD